jgi:rhamnogalacturonan endolyase
MFGDFVPEVPGMEFYSAEQDGTGRWLYSAATGELLGEQDLGGLSPRAIWWDDTPVKAYIPGRTFSGGRGGRGGRGPVADVAAGGTTRPVQPPAGRGGGAFGNAVPSAIMKYGAGRIGEFEGRLVSIADIVGDWREEIIVSLPGELRVYSTVAATTRRRPALMQDPVYRKDVALQAMGYFYPPQLSYHFR